MDSRLIHEAAGQRTYVLVFAPAEEVLAGLTAFASDRGIAAASVVAIGGLSAATLGFFDVERKTYERLPVMEQVEVLSMAGNVAVDEQHRPKVHVHVVLGRRDGSVCGGHLLDARVRPTLEVVLQESPRFLRRRARPDLGLALLDLDRAPASR